MAMGEERRQLNREMVCKTKPAMAAGCVHNDIVYLFSCNVHVLRRGGRHQ